MNLHDHLHLHWSRGGGPLPGFSCALLHQAQGRGRPPCSRASDARHTMASHRMKGQIEGEPVESRRVLARFHIARAITAHSLAEKRSSHQKRNVSRETTSPRRQSGNRRWESRSRQRGPQPEARGERTSAGRSKTTEAPRRRRPQSGLLSYWGKSRVPTHRPDEAKADLPGLRDFKRGSGRPSSDDGERLTEGWDDPGNSNPVTGTRAMRSARAKTCRIPGTSQPYRSRAPHNHLCDEELAAARPL